MRLSALIGLVLSLASVAALAKDASPDSVKGLYLATSPGGADSVSIIAASTKVDMPFVLAMQVARFVLVVVVGPAQARLLSRSAKLAEA